MFSSNIDRPASLATTSTTPKTRKSTAVTRLRQKPALSASESALNNKNLDEKKKCLKNSSCCDCFPSPKKRWSDSGSAQMSDIYIGKEGKLEDFSTPACLNNMNTRKSQNLLSIESEIEFRGSLNGKKKNDSNKKTESLKKSPKIKGNETTPKKRSKNYEIELADEACAESDDPEICLTKEEKSLHISPKINGKHASDDEIVIVEERNTKNTKHSTKISRKLQKSISIAQESITSSDKSVSSPSNTLPRPKGINRFFTYNRNKQNKINENVTENNQETSFCMPEPVKCEFQLALDSAMKACETIDLNGNPKMTTENKCNTLPKMKKSHFHPSILYSRGDTNRTPFKVPKRTTADGTTIYYWCDVPKKQIKGLKFVFLVDIKHLLLFYGDLIFFCILLINFSFFCFFFF